MYNIRLLILILSFTQLSVLVTAQCRLNTEQVQNETRVVAFQNGYQFEIFNEDKVKTGTTLYFICSDTDVISVKCNRNKRFSHSLPIQNCDKPLKAIVEQIRDDTCSAQAYRIVYKFQGKSLEVYRSCFNKSKVHAISSTHIANPATIVAKRPLTPFTRDGVITVKDAATFQARSVFKRFKTLLGANQPYITSERVIVIDRGHLTPSGDYIFEANMNATFKYINIIPQFSSINRGNWKSIENFIRKRLDETGSGRIWTGAFDVLQLKDQNNNLVPIYLQENRKNPIPKWMYKMFRNEEDFFVFVTLNNIFAEYEPNAICSTIVCPIQLKRSKESGFTYCCDPEHFMRNILPRIS